MAQQIIMRLTDNAGTVDEATVRAFAVLAAQLAREGVSFRATVEGDDARVTFTGGY